MSDSKESLKASKKIYISMRTCRIFAAYPLAPDLKEVYLDVMTTTALLCGALTEEDAIANFRDCLRWVRGESAAEEPKPPSELN